MKNKVEISKINIRIGDKEIPLTLEEAQELRKILDETFGKKMVVYPSPPIYIERPFRRVYPYWQVDYGYSTDGNTATYTLTTGGANSATNTSDPDAIPVM